MKLCSRWSSIMFNMFVTVFLNAFKSHFFSKCKKIYATTTCSDSIAEHKHCSCCWVKNSVCLQLTVKLSNEKFGESVQDVSVLYHRIPLVLSQAEHPDCIKPWVPPYCCFHPHTFHAAELDVSEQSLCRRQHLSPDWWKQLALNMYRWGCVRRNS